ncbi:MAG TPA: NADPH:quinone oxidoreductase family protein [Acidisarcina sp.]
MKTVRFHRTGGPEVLVFEDVPEPIPGRSDVLIRVEAAGMNFADVLRRRGDPYPEPSPMPMTVGSEVAGTVVALGSDVTGIPLGSLVYAACRIGGYAQFVAVLAQNVIPIPNGVTAIQATTLVVQGLTALFALRDAGRLSNGESVLIEAAAGGVGSFAVQLAKLLGAGRVIAAASTAKKREFTLSLGADDAVDYTAPDFAHAVKSLTEGRGVDIVLEMTGGPTFHRALDALASFGRMVVYGLSSGESVTIDPQLVVVPNQSIVGFYIGGYFQRPDVIRQGLQELVDHVVAGRVSVQVGTVLPLEMAAEAHRLLEGRLTTGKVVLQPWAS